MKLSKREIILLIFLLIIGLSFLEYNFVLKPGLAKFSDLSEKELALTNELDTIDLNLQMAKAMEKNLSANLQKIDVLAQPYLSGVHPDALLVYTHNMMIKHGFSPKTYGPSPMNTTLLQPESAEIVDITYRIKEIAAEYQAAENGTSETTNETEANGEGIEATEDPDTAVNDIVECYTLQVTASGTYDQIRALIDDFDSLDRWIQISNMTIEPSQSVIELLDIDFMINYYGIVKLKPTDDPINQWTQDELISSTDDPYVHITESTEPTETTTETTAA